MEESALKTMKIGIVTMSAALNQSPKCLILPTEEDVSVLSKVLISEVF